MMMTSERSHQYLPETILTYLTLIFEPMRINFNVKNIGFMLALFDSFFNCLQGLVL